MNFLRFISLFTCNEVKIMTEKKCTKYESLFTFSSEEELKEHLDECEDCRREQEEMDKISELIQEVRPYYFQKRTNSINSFKVACVLFIGLFAGTLLGYFVQFPYVDSSSYTVSSTSSVSNVNEYGMALDNYGLITVN